MSPLSFLLTSQPFIMTQFKIFLRNLQHLNIFFDSVAWELFTFEANINSTFNAAITWTIGRIPSIAPYGIQGAQAMYIRF